MSFKAKDLTYDASQPAFLRRLRGQVAGDDSARHERPTPRNSRLKNDDEDDGPTYVLEDSNQSLTKSEYEALVAGKDAKTEEESGTTTVENAEEVAVANPGPQLSKDNIVEVGKAIKKRKAVKVIGSEQEGGGSVQDAHAKVTKKPKKKSKPVKLSFGDQEEG